jgi:putative membrane protein
VTTSSEPGANVREEEESVREETAPDEAGAAGTSNGSTAVELAAGRLHPGFLFLRALDGLRQAVFPLVLGLVTGQAWFAAVALLVFLLGTFQALARFLTFEWRLTSEELITTEGILHRQERRIPVNRIQDLNFESSLLRRLFGLVIVSVETASSQGAEARLDSLSRADAESLRATLFNVRSEKAGTPVRPEELEDEEVLFRVTPLDLILRGLTTNRVGALLVAAFGLYELALQFGLEQRVDAVFGGIAGSLGGRALPVVLAIVLGVGFLAVCGGWVLSIGAAFVVFHDFTLSLRGDVFLRRYGLITTRANTLPRRKIQRVVLDQSPMRRLIGMAVVRADTAGSGAGEGAEASSGSDLVTPLAPLGIATMLVPWLLPGFGIDGLTWNRVSPRVVMRIFMRTVTLSLVLVALAWSALGIWALSALAILPFGFGAGVLAYRNMGWARAEGHIAFRQGVLGLHRAVVPLRKVQAVVLRAGPIERWLGLASLTVYVAGGSPTRLGYLPRAEARRLELSIAADAAERRFVW